MAIIPTQPHAELVPFHGTPEQVYRQLLAEQATRPLYPQGEPFTLQDGHILLLTSTVAPTSSGPPNGQPPTPWWRAWNPFIVATTAIIGLAVLSVVGVLTAYALAAVVNWGITHALGIGVALIVVFICGLITIHMVTQSRRTNQYPTRGSW